MSRESCGKVVFVGGGTMGSVSPLLAIYEELKKDKKIKFFWAGTCRGVEKKALAAYADISFQPILSGKWRRYFSLKNIFAPFLTIIGFCQAFFWLKKIKPNIVVSAGSFVSVPVCWAAFCCRVPIIIHQMDIRPGLANKLVAPLATKITVGFPKSLKDYPAKKTIWTGIPIRESLSKKTNLPFLRNPKKPLVLILGGGTGSLFLNNLTEKSLPELVKICQVAHLTGPRKKSFTFSSPDYFSWEFLSNLGSLYQEADLIVCRAGLGTLSELAYFGKAALVMPLPQSHQEENAAYFAQKKAILLFPQAKATPDSLVAKIKKMLYNEKERKKIEKNISQLAKKDAREKIKELIEYYGSI